MNIHRVPLLISASHDCAYLGDRQARNLVVDPYLPMDPMVYQQLLDRGFRRSGDAVYRPHCSGCAACVPVRIPVNRFLPTRAQRRCMQRNADLRVQRGRSLDDAAFALYRRYLAARHPDGGMDGEDRTGFERFLRCSWGETEIWRFSLDEQLLGCAVVDVLPNGFSAVYTFFDPDPIHASRGIGTYAVLSQIAFARAEARSHVWLGYWVPGCNKMAYKERFLPQERLQHDQWHTIAVPPGMNDNAGLAQTKCQTK
jgi:arginyl-tRNA--protein-N-Asp/Glu arginylyltransferase